jgi:hypothetical protein
MHKFAIAALFVALTAGAASAAPVTGIYNRRTSAGSC